MKHPIISKLCFFALPKRMEPRWKHILDSSKKSRINAEVKTPEVANVFVNGLLAYTPDEQDNWQTASESLQRGKGDCEDFAILKRELLVQAGFDPLMIIGFDMVLRQHHAVLAVEHLGTIKVLDNLTNDILTWSDTGLAPKAAYGTKGCWAIASA